MTATTVRTAPVTASGPPGARGPRRAVRSRAGHPGPSPLRRLRGQAGSALLLVAALLAVALTAFGAARSDLHRLADVSEPRAVAAADLDRALADLDAQHADELVVGYSTVPPPPGQPPTLVDDGVLAELTALADRSRVDADLTALAAAGPADGRSVQALLDGLSRYDSLSGTEEFSATSQADPIVGRPPDLALDYYDQAEGELQQSLLPQVHALLDAAQQQVDRDRDAAQRDSRLGALALGLLGPAALALLVWWQLDLTRRHRRVFNPALLLATAAVLAVALSGVLVLLGAAAEVGSAVSGGYSRYAATAQAQVEAADAEASESRWLVDDAYRPLLRQQYADLMATLGGRSDPDAGLPAVVRTRTAYLAADAQLRSLAGSGALDQASVQLTGVTRGEVAFAYYDFSSQLDQLAQQQLVVAATHFGSAVDGLSGWTVLPSVLLGVALLLVLAGVRPRLAEFA